MKKKEEYMYIRKQKEMIIVENWHQLTNIIWYKTLFQIAIDNVQHHFTIYSFIMNFRTNNHIINKLTKVIVETNKQTQQQKEIKYREYEQWTRMAVK